MLGNLSSCLHAVYGTVIRVRRFPNTPMIMIRRILVTNSNESSLQQWGMQMELFPILMAGTLKRL